MKIQQGGVWSAGICSPASDLNTDLGQDHNSWAVTSGGVVRTRGAQEYSLTTKLEEGDVLGFSYDHVELNIYCNGKNLDTPVLGIKGTVFPVFYGGRFTFTCYVRNICMNFSVSVDEGAILDCIFEDFQHPLPSGFERIMIEKALL